MHRSGIGGGHASEQAPLVQPWPIGQAMLQPPQFWGSVCVSTQTVGLTVGQAVGCAAEQLRVHAPETHTSPGMQVTPQAPQFLTSVVTTTQLWPHAVYPWIQFVGALSQPKNRATPRARARTGTAPRQLHSLLRETVVHGTEVSPMRHPSYIRQAAG